MDMMKKTVSNSPKLQIALVGNPNCGKSLLFNRLTGLNHKVGNFPGITVEKRSGTFRFEGKDYELTDLPGAYSINPQTLDEELTFNLLMDPRVEHRPDLIVLVADASNLRRNLFYLSQLAELSIPLLIVLNKIDLAEARGLRIDQAAISQMFNAEVVAVNARKPGNLLSLKMAIANSSGIESKNDLIDPILESSILSKLEEIFPDFNLFESETILLNHTKLKSLSEVEREGLENLLASSGIDEDNLEARRTIKRYGRIADYMKQIISEGEESEGPYQRFSRKLDKLLIHPVYGYIIFVLVLGIVFQSIFSWAVAPMDWIESIFSAAGNWIHTTLGDNWFAELIADGVLAGLSGIAVFIPQIALLFFFISLLEESGYMARVSFLMDNFLRRFGLNGLSSVALMSGFACAIPAIMSARIIGSWRERLLTILVTPLMSCSARLPVYALLIAFIVPEDSLLGPFNLQGLVMLAMYLLGFVTGILVALLFKLFIKERNPSVFSLELPVYQRPQIRNVFTTVYEKSLTFVTEAGKVILVVSVILWFLASFGPGNSMKEVEAKYAAMEQTDSLNARLEMEKLENSFAGRIGRGMEPAIRPLGYDWKIGIALLTSFAAREVFVGTMSTIYELGSSSSEVEGLRAKMKRDRHRDSGLPVYSMATVVSLLLFYAFAMQCMSTLAITYKETGGWKWTLIQLLYMSILAYSSAFVAYQLLK